MIPTNALGNCCTLSTNIINGESIWGIENVIIRNGNGK